jgi:1,4-alpha-glucan branching enzyme
VDPQESKRERGRPQGKRKYRIAAPRRKNTLLGAEDLRHFSAGTHSRLYETMGAHLAQSGDKQGATFTVWAPNAKAVSVVGDFNDWSSTQTPLKRIKASGVWTGFVEGVSQGALYKYQIDSRFGNYQVQNADPFAFHCETPPATASVVWDLDYSWGDADWMSKRAGTSTPDAPMSTYEVHLGSWKHPGDDSGRKLTYRELADQLTDYLTGMNFTHVELMPPFEHPYFGSWGYQPTALFAPTSRYGSPQDFSYLIDTLHQHGLGVILDWVPSHFPADKHGLEFFDGTHLYEHADPRLGFHPDWKTYLFNYGRPEVVSFLISSCMFWLERYHIDAIRVDAVASMLYLDYSREDGEWIPNRHGGRENLDAISFLKQLNTTVHDQFPEVTMIAEESTSWPLVSRPVKAGGLGFDMKWDMGWMNDSLEYFQLDPIHRNFNHNKITFRMMYAFSENFVLPLSHDEVVHGKSSMLGKMAGDEWQKFANLRSLYGYMYGQPGKKLLFMGNELGQWNEWSHERQLDWHLLQFPLHRGLKNWVSDLNRIYREQPALHELDFDPSGFNWIDCDDASQSIISFVRRGRQPDELIMVVCNFTPVPRTDYVIGAPRAGDWIEVLNSDAEAYGGSGMGNPGSLASRDEDMHGLAHSLKLTLPPLSTLFIKHRSKAARSDQE